MNCITVGMSIASPAIMTSHQHRSADPKRVTGWRVWLVAGFVLCTSLAASSCYMRPHTAAAVANVAAAAIITAAIVGQLTVLEYHDSHYHHHHCGHHRRWHNERWVYHYHGHWEYYDEYSGTWYYYSE